MTTYKPARTVLLALPFMLNGCLLPFDEGNSESNPAGGPTTSPSASDPAGTGACIYTHSAGSYCSFSTGSVSDVDDSWGCSPVSSLEACWAITDGYSDYSGGCSFVSTYSDVEYLEGKTCQELEEGQSGALTTPTSTTLSSPVVVSPAGTTPRSPVVVPAATSPSLPVAVTPAATTPVTP